MTSSSHRCAGMSVEDTAARRVHPASLPRCGRGGDSCRPRSGREGGRCWEWYVAHGPHGPVRQESGCLRATLRVCTRLSVPSLLEPGPRGDLLGAGLTPGAAQESRPLGSRLYLLSAPRAAGREGFGPCGEARSRPSSRVGRAGGCVSGVAGTWGGLPGTAHPTGLSSRWL